MPKPRDYHLSEENLAAIEIELDPKKGVSKILCKWQISLATDFQTEWLTG
jgi:hypothetical protein